MGGVYCLKLIIKVSLLSHVGPELLKIDSEIFSTGTRPRRNIERCPYIAAWTAAPFLIRSTVVSSSLVDDRLASEGTGKALGINDPILGWVIIGVFTTIWAVYYVATKDLGGQREEDGLGL